MEKIQKIIFLKFFVILLFTFLGFLPTSIQAASLVFYPASGSYTVGGSIPVNVYVSSSDQAMNAASGTISFPQDKLEVVSISKAGSIFTLWAQEPSFSNSTGTVNFEGIALSGFTGSSGKILTVNFKVKSTGSAPVSFSSSSVLANDGQGTNILSNLGTATFTLGEAKAITIEEPETPGVPVAPIISSSTHPDSSRWYNASTAKFNWSLSPSITGVRILVNKIAKSIPTMISTTLINSKELNNIEDGIWYLHLQFRNINGWGEVSHFRFQVDTKKPNSFDIQEVKRDNLTNPRVRFSFVSEDETSGIDHYEIQINEERMQDWQDTGSGIYETPILSYGKYLLIAKAVDKAGNMSANSVEFTINPLDTPKITECPEKAKSGEVFDIKGTTYSDSKVVLWLQREGEDAQALITQSDKDGNFTFTINEELRGGSYKVSVEVVNDEGARIKSIEKTIIITNQPLNFNIGQWTISVIAIIILLIAIIVGLIILVIYYWSKSLFINKKKNKETPLNHNPNSNPNIIKRKIPPEYFDLVNSKKKNFELRVAEFEVKEGDIIILEEWDPDASKYTGRKIERKVGYVLNFKLNDFGQEELIKEKGLIVFSLEDE